ncbi:MAG: nuclear transport factor 2 family protein [Phycisphaerae bacterium]|nr:nuclear transport factor 2 family protein [Phycisphaerae bacterium]
MKSVQQEVAGVPASAAMRVMKAILDNPTDIDHVRAWTAPDVTYVSLNHDNAMLKSVMPWCGTRHGPQAIVDTFKRVARYWSIEAFEPDAVFGDGEHAAMFGRFTYRSTTLGKQVTSPFAVYARVVAGKCVYLQFMEDTLATTESFRKGGAWLIHSNPDGGEVTI